jgi:hypothetical protein
MNGRMKRVMEKKGIEGAYSSIKRIFGEYVSAKKFVNMAREMVIKVSPYNMFMRMTPDYGEG